MAPRIAEKLVCDLQEGTTELVEYEISDASIESSRAMTEHSLRAARNAQLAETDYTQLSDVPDGVGDAAMAYRQALRDWPETDEFKEAVESCMLIEPPKP